VQLFQAPKRGRGPQDRNGFGVNVGGEHYLDGKDIQAQKRKPWGGDPSGPLISKTHSQLEKHTGEKTAKKKTTRKKIRGG